MENPYLDWPRFEKCSVNVCPLDPKMQEKEQLPGETGCPMRKSVRLRLGKDLSWLGLTPRELTAKRKRDSMSPADKEAMGQRMRLLRQKAGQMA